MILKTFLTLGFNKVIEFIKKANEYFTNGKIYKAQNDIEIRTIKRDIKRVERKQDSNHKEIMGYLMANK